MAESRIPWKGDSPEHTSTDCRTPDGVTVGLIDGVIATCRVLRERNLTTPAVLAALSDLWQDEDVRHIVVPGTAVVVDSARHLRAEAEGRLDAVRAELNAVGPGLRRATQPEWNALVHRLRDAIGSTA